MVIVAQYRLSLGQPWQRGTERSWDWGRLTSHGSFDAPGRHPDHPEPDIPAHHGQRSFSSAPNLMKQDLHHTGRTRKGGDITDIGTREGWIDLAVILDLLRGLIGWAISKGRGFSGVV